MLANIEMWEDVKKRSLSDNEYVMRYTDALELIDVLHQEGVDILGWEGWLRYPDGQFGHSNEHQGTSGLGKMPRPSVVALLKSTIMQANMEWVSSQSDTDAELLFCITTGT